MTWLVDNTAAVSREAAACLGAEMLGRGLIFHVRHRHGFEDKRNRLYRCSEDQLAEPKLLESGGVQLAEMFRETLSIIFLSRKPVRLTVF